MSTGVIDRSAQPSPQIHPTPPNIYLPSVQIHREHPTMTELSDTHHVNSNNTSMDPKMNLKDGPQVILFVAGLQLHSFLMVGLISPTAKQLVKSHT